MSDLARPPLPDWRRGLRWFAAESLVIITSILVALAVQSWWNDRSARIQEQALLKRLRAEFISNRDQYEEAANAQQGIIAMARRVLEWTGPEPAKVDVETFESHVFPLVTVLPTYRAATSELDAMLGSGQLALIRNDRLRAQIAAWPVVLQRLRRTEDILTDEVIDEFYPYVLERIPLINLHIRGGIINMTPSRFERNYEALLRDVRFENHVENRWLLAVTILERMKTVHALMEEITGMLDAELADSASD